MPRQIQSIPITFANTGIVLKSSPDEIPLTSYKALVNVVTDRENTLSVRKGFERLNGGLPSPPYSFYFLKDINGRQWRYAIASNALYVAPVVDPVDALVWPLALHDQFAAVPGGHGLSTASDPRPIYATYTLIGYDMKPYIFLADGTKFLKHSGGMGNATRVGIPKPLPITSISLEPNSTEDIEIFEDFTEWTPDNSTIAQVSPGHIPTSDAISIKINGNKAVGGGFKATSVGGYPVILDLGINDPDGVIEIWYQFPTTTDALNCKEIIIVFGLSTTVGDVTFKTRFEKAITSSAFEAASQVGSTGRTSTYGDSTSEGAEALTIAQTLPVSQSYNDIERGEDYDSKSPRAYKDLDPYVYQDPRDQVDTGRPSTMRPGTGVWNKLLIKKSEFSRAGTSALTEPGLNWNCVTSIRIDIKNIDVALGSKDCEVYFDDFVYLTTGNLIGIDYLWTYTYYNSITGTESDFADYIEVPYPGAEHSQYRLVFPPCPGITPPASDPNKIRIYRMGGTALVFMKVGEINYTPGVIPADFVDNTLDSMQEELMKTDRQLPPDGVKGVVLWDDRLFIWGGSITDSLGNVIQEPPNRLRFSKAVLVEEFPVQANYVYVGTGSEQIQNCIEHDGELFVFTLTKVWRIVGSNGAYRAVGTAVNQGLKVPHGLVKGTRSVFMYAYDGIYEFPSGRKISEVINPLFFGEMVNEIPPIAAGREESVSVAFYDSKVYFSYCRTDDPAVTNDAILVWDTLYERWHWYLYGSRALYLEPENNILVGGQIVQWDSIVDGEPANFHYTGPWPMRLEHGFADQCQPPDNFRGIFWAVDTKDYDLGMPDQEKRFFDFVVDADTQGTPILLQAAFDIKHPDSPQDAPPYESIGTVETLGRQRVILPVAIGEGDSVLATRVALRILANTSASSTGATRLFKVIHRILPEPLRHRMFVTDWSDYGTQGPKFFRELWVELDSFGNQLDSIEVQVDQGLAHVITPVPVVEGQTKLYFGLPIDLRGTLARLKFIPNGDNEVKVWDHNFQVMAEPPQINTIQSPWSDESWPYPKLWKEVLLDIDTARIPISFSFWLDGIVVETFLVITQNGRERITHSLPKDTFGKLGRVTMSEPYFDPTCCLPEGVRFYGVSYVIDKEPADVTFSDTYEQLFSYPRLKVLRRLWIAMKNPNYDVIMEIYADDVLMVTKTILADLRSTGFSKRRIDLESAIKGRLIRITFTSVFAFQLYWERSEWEIKDMNTEDGYRREAMVPPQTF